MEDYLQPLYKRPRLSGPEPFHLMSHSGHGFHNYHHPPPPHHRQQHHHHRGSHGHHGHHHHNGNGGGQHYSQQQQQQQQQLQQHHHHGQHHPSDARANMDLDFGLQMYIRDTDVGRSMLMGNGLPSNAMVDFGPASGPDWRRTMCLYNRNFFMHRVSEMLIDSARNGGNTDDRQTWFAVVKKIEGKAFKTATSKVQYYDLIKEEIDKVKVEYGLPSISSQYLPTSSTTSATAANNIQLVNMQQNFRPNFGDPAVTASQSHPQPGLAHSATSVNLFSEESMRNPIRVPVTSSMGSARSQYEAFNSRQSGPRPLVHDQVSNTNIQLANSEQVIPTNLLHPLNSLMATPIGQPFMPSSAAGSQQQQQQQQQQQRGNGFSASDPGSQGVLSEQNCGLINSQNMVSRVYVKEWHKSISFNSRNRLIRKMAQILSTTPDPQSGNMEAKMHNCIAIATGVENEVFRTASSLTHYYDWMAKRCHFIAKERATPTQGGIQYFNLSDIRRTYEALGIAYPVTGHSTYPPVAVNNASSPQQPQQPQQQPPPPPPGVMPPGFMGSGGGAGVPPYCTFGRGQSVSGPPPPPPPAALPQPPPPGHNQLIDRLLQGAMPLSMDAAEVPEVIKQLAHAYKCQERENQENDVMMLCSLRHCRETKNLLNHITTCQVGLSCCGSTKEIIEHWNHCTVNDCPICLPVRQAERSLSSSVATSTSIGSQMTMNPSYMRRPHRIGYPSTATSGLLSNQSPGSVSSARSERISPRSSMWHSSYSNDSWQRSSGIGSSGAPPDGGPIDSSLPIGRRSQPRFWLHNRNPGGSRHERRPFNNPYPPEIIFVENSRGGGQPPRGSSLFGPIGNSRLNAGRLQPYGTPWRSPDILFVENVRPAHRQPSSREYIDEPVIIPSDEEATPTEHQQMMAIVKVVKTSGCRLEQKFRCARRSCSDSWPCLHRRLAASIQSNKTPIPA
ncbi:hypothetical protein QAD02_015440 [Eretmocerus hayati]|uniref:Uncharacterized protein n=1 Tax=Eretmocerus hayati TaxID=131215 RepID=A0ACC2P975_9HYME|nr:hypothetical protein QAD02_015440 [Eretmocerus hayati]